MQKTNKNKNSIDVLDSVLVISGPTASGKSQLALDCAEYFDGEIVNADSMQVYHELPILTGRPSFEDESRVPHHLYGIRSISEQGSAGQWLQAATKKIKEIRDRDKVPIVCGGTGLYLKVLREGIAPVPSIPNEVVDTARRLYDEEGGIKFHTRLKEIDPKAAGRLPYKDRQRLIRAFVVQQTTGHTLDEWQARQSSYLPVEGLLFTVNIVPPREALYERIDQRLLGMLEAGALEEVARLEPDLDPNLPALKILGVRELQSYFSGECSLDEAIIKVQQATRNFAKRQITWFRNQLTADFLIDGFGDKCEKTTIQEIAASSAVARSKIS